MSKLLASNAAAHEDSITSLIWTTADVILTGSIDETVKCWRPDALDRPIDTIKDQELSVVAICTYLCLSPQPNLTLSPSG